MATYPNDRDAVILIGGQRGVRYISLSMTGLIGKMCLDFVRGVRGEPGG